jgi:hypothetical protein
MRPPAKASWFRGLAGTELRKSVLQSFLITLVTWFAGPTPAAARDTANRPPGPPIVCLRDAAGGIMKANTRNNSVIATAPFTNNANRVAITPDRLGPGDGCPDKRTAERHSSRQ